MKMAGFYDESISNGLGWRAVLFVSGCPHNCPGCHNKAAQDFNYGENFDEENIINRIKETGYTLEELKNRNDNITTKTLNNIDVLVDGRFIESRKNPELKFRGSDNQRILDIKKCLNENKIINLEI